METELWHAKKAIEECEKQLKKLPHLEAMHELLDTCEALDIMYKSFCAEFDKDDGLEKDTTYNSNYGPNIEFYIEADDWHDISKALRTLRKGK